MGLDLSFQEIDLAMLWRIVWRGKDEDARTLGRDFGCPEGSRNLELENDQEVLGWYMVNVTQTVWTWASFSVVWDRGAARRKEACRVERLAQEKVVLVVLGFSYGSFPHGLDGNARWVWKADGWKWSPESRRRSELETYPISHAPGAEESLRGRNEKRELKARSLRIVLEKRRGNHW